MSRLAAAVLLVAALASACGEPPDKEMHQAQGAIDAARAAGADRYAPAELSAATTALAAAHDAVEQGDYRLALSQALDARERAQSAAREAADQKALIRSEVERTLTAVDEDIARAETRLKAAHGVRSAADAASAVDRQLPSAREAVQKARSALASGDYLAARDALAGVRDELKGALDALDTALAPRRRR
jgi:hypothetical protein